MPRGDRTGPMGMGSMTGRRVGFCAGFAAPGYMNSVPGYEIGSGRGCGFRRMFYRTGMPGWARYGHPVSPYPAYGDANIPVADEKEILTN